MGKRVLVTGGAGFIGSHTVDELIAQGHTVRVYDNLNPQVHGEGADKPNYLNPDAEFVKGDVRDRDHLYKSIKNIDLIIIAILINFFIPTNLACCNNCSDTDRFQ